MRPAARWATLSEDCLIVWAGELLRSVVDSLGSFGMALPGHVGASARCGGAKQETRSGRIGMIVPKRT